eukprot:SAG11_NODE_21242_length_429_cov_0.560606_1_plen_87_part_00
MAQGVGAADERGADDAGGAAAAALRRCAEFPLLVLRLAAGCLARARFDAVELLGEPFAAALPNQPAAFAALVHDHHPRALVSTSLA